MPYSAPKLLAGNSFSNQVPGSTTTVDVVPDGTYYDLTLRYEAGATSTLADEATMISDLEEIRVIMNGRVQHRYSAQELLTWLKFHKVPISNGFLKIPFYRPWMKSQIAREVTRVGTAGLTTFQIEVDIASAAVNPRLKLVFTKLLANSAVGSILKFRKTVIPVTAAGVRNETNLPKIDPYAQMHFFEAQPGDVQAVKIELDNTRQYEADAAENSDFLKYWDYAEQPGVFSIPFDYRRQAGELFDPIAVRDGNTGAPLRAHPHFQIDLEMAAGRDVKLMQVLFGPRD